MSPLTDQWRSYPDKWFYLSWKAFLRYSRVSSLCYPFASPDVCVGITWGPLVVDSWWRTVANFSNGPLCLKTQRCPWPHASRPLRDGIDYFCAFHGSNCSDDAVRQAGRTIYTANFAISGGTTVKRCCGYICVGEALQQFVYSTASAVMWQSLHLKRKGCVLRYTFLNGLGWTIFLVS